jgi:hypothetical protein
VTWFATAEKLEQRIPINWGGVLPFSAVASSAHIHKRGVGTRYIIRQRSCVRKVLLSSCAPSVSAEFSFTDVQVRWWYYAGHVSKDTVLGLRDVSHSFSRGIQLPCLPPSESSSTSQIPPCQSVRRHPSSRYNSPRDARSLVPRGSSNRRGERRLLRQPRSIHSHMAHHTHGTASRKICPPTVVIGDNGACRDHRNGFVEAAAGWRPMAEVKFSLGVDWARDGDEWLSQLRSLIAIRSLESFGGDNSELLDVIQCEADDPRLLSTLRAARSSDGQIECVIIADDDAAEVQEKLTDQIGPWRDAAFEAAARVGTLTPGVWNAVLGPRPQLHTGWVAIGADLRPSALSVESLVGTVRLLPASVLLNETPDAHPDWIGEDRFPFASWPMIVEGVASSFAEYPDLPANRWPMDGQSARREAHRVAALVSLAWDECWIVRRGPARIAVGERIEISHPAADCQVDKRAHVAGPTKYRERELPGWLDAAWHALDGNPDLAGALSAYYEAQQLDTAHPSAAFLLYVTALERVGVDLAKPQRCPTCKMVPGATARFRTALSTVMTESEAKELTKTAYGRRSLTAHQGTLHGSEHTLGALPDSDFRIHDAQRFEDDELAEIRRTARAVLVRVLDGSAAKAAG